MPAPTKYDLAIVGSGSAAFAAAIEARRRGASVVMIESGIVGGTCVNTGCVPSKAMLAAAEARHIALGQHFPGVTTSAGVVDMAKLATGKDAIVDALRQEKYVEVAAHHGFSVLPGRARFVGAALEVNGRRIEATHYVIATGATTYVPPIDGLAAAGYRTPASAMALDHVPDSLVVLGGSASGLEMAQLFARLGSRVTILEARASIAPAEEPELREALTGILADDDIDVRAGVTVARVQRRGDGVAVAVHDAGGRDEITGSTVLVATGRRPRTDSLGLETIGVDLGPRGEVVVDDELRTSNPRIFAAGDVTGHPQFVYVAARHGAIVAANALASDHQRVDYRALPRVTFTAPALASVGLTQARAEALGIDCVSRVLSLVHVPRAVVSRDTRGVAKIVANAVTGEVLGVHLVADGAGEVILAAVYAIEAGFTVERLAASWTPYLTMGEAIKLTAQSFTRDVGSLSCCAA